MTDSAFAHIEQIIKSGLPDAKIKITDMTGTRDHLDIVVASDAFLGKGLIEQHQIIMDLLKESLKSDIHAVKLKTMDFTTQKKRGIEFP